MLKTGMNDAQGSFVINRELPQFMAAVLEQSIFL